VRVASSLAGGGAWVALLQHSLPSRSPAALDFLARKVL